MSTPESRALTLAALARVWDLLPTLRLGQLICMACEDWSPAADLFGVADHNLAMGCLLLKRRIALMRGACATCGRVLPLEARNPEWQYTGECNACTPYTEPDED